MPTPIETVTAFLARFSEGKEGLYDSVRTAFTPKTVWENVGLAVTTGPEEALALAKQFEEQMGVASVAIEIKAIAASGNKVLTERIDHLLTSEGSELEGSAVMGTFEVQDGKIIAWRDYFDTAAAQSLAQKWALKQKGGGSES